MGSYGAKGRVECCVERCALVNFLVYLGNTALQLEGDECDQELFTRLFCGSVAVEYFDPM